MKENNTKKIAITAMMAAIAVVITGVMKGTGVMAVLKTQLAE